MVIDKSYITIFTEGFGLECRIICAHIISDKTVAAPLGYSDIINWAIATYYPSDHFGGFYGLKQSIGEALSNPADEPSQKTQSETDIRREA